MGHAGNFDAGQNASPDARHSRAAGADRLGHRAIRPRHLAAGGRTGADRRAGAAAQSSVVSADPPALRRDRHSRTDPDSRRHLYLCQGTAGVLGAGMVRPQPQPLRQARAFYPGRDAGPARPGNPVAPALRRAGEDAGLSRGLRRAGIQRLL